MRDSMVIAAYGNSTADRGMFFLKEQDGVSSLEFLPVDGKCNFCIRVGNRLYASVQTAEPCLWEYRFENGVYMQTGIYPTRYFYSHGVVCQGMLFLASFSDGVDAIYDMEQHQEIDFYIHRRTGYTKNGHSHYIGATADQRHIYAVDNSLQQIYLYNIEDRRFAVNNVREFCEENIRLMPYSPYSGCYYLNTEITNRVYVLTCTEDQFQIRAVMDLACEKGSFSGGNAVSRDGKRLCVTTRGDNYLHYFQILPDGSLKLLKQAACGEMPRDVYFKGDSLYVTCTSRNAVEVYDTKGDRLKKIKEIGICQPITFGLE